MVLQKNKVKEILCKINNLICTVSYSACKQEDRKVVYNRLGKQYDKIRMKRM